MLKMELIIQTGGQKTADYFYNSRKPPVYEVNTTVVCYLILYTSPLFYFLPEQIEQSFPGFSTKNNSFVVFACKFLSCSKSENNFFTHKNNFWHDSFCTNVKLHVMRLLNNHIAVTALPRVGILIF